MREEAKSAIQVQASAVSVSETVRAVLEEYLKYRKNTVSPQTYTLDGYCFRPLREYLTQSDAGGWREFALGYLGWLRENHHRHSLWTLNIYSDRFYAMLRWAVEEGFLERIPLRRRELIRRPEPNPEPFTASEVAQILDALTGSDWQTMRNRALIIVGIELGCRRGELLQMRVGDLERGYSEVRQKGNRLHILHLTDNARRAIKEYLDAYTRDTKQKLQTDDYLWRNGHTAPMHGDDLRKIMARLSHRVGKRLYFHRLRQTSATLRLALGASTEVVREALGHTSDRALRHYVKIANEQQRALLEATSPFRAIQKQESAQKRSAKGSRKKRACADS